MLLSFQLVLLLAFFHQSISAPAPDDLINDPEINLPDYFKVCPRNSENLNACLKDSLQTIIPNLGNGIKEIGLPPIEGVLFEDLVVNQKVSGINGKFTLRNYTLYGLTNIQVKSVKAEINDKGIKLDMDVLYPNLYFEGKYKGQVNLIGLLLRAAGYFNITFYNVTHNYKIEGIVEQRNGEDYIKITKIQLNKPEATNIQVYIGGLFPNNPEIASAVLDVINQEWKAINVKIAPIYSPLHTNFMLKTSNKIFMNVPFRRLLPVE